MKYTVETGVPVPPVARKYYSGLSLVMRNLPVGGSIFIETDSHVRPSRTTVRRLGEAGYRFTTRKVEGGYRVWRIE